MEEVRNPRRKPPGGGDGGRQRTPLAPGTFIAELSSGREAEILEHACQYAHPQAAPVFQYLVRWEDGQIEAISEGALRSGGGLEVLEDEGAGD